MTPSGYEPPKTVYRHVALCGNCGALVYDPEHEMEIVERHELDGQTGEWDEKCLMPVCRQCRPGGKGEG